MDVDTSMRNTRMYVQHVQDELTEGMNHNDEFDNFNDLQTNYNHYRDGSTENIYYDQVDHDPAILDQFNYC